MRKIGFVVDSTFGYNGKFASVVPLKVIIDNKEYVDGTIGEGILVDALKNNKSITTSQPSPNLFVQAFEHELEKYDHVICLTLSKTLSGTFNSANLAKDILEKENIIIIDTETVTEGALYIFEELLKLADEGKSLEEVLGEFKRIKANGSIIFSVDDLSTLVKGGRLGKISGIIGSLLRIKPILRFKEGVLTVEAKVRGLMSSFKYIIDQAKVLAEHSNIIVRITYVDNRGYADQIYEMFKELNNDKIDVKIGGTLSPVVAAHIGLGGMGIYLAKV